MITRHGKGARSFRCRIWLRFVPQFQRVSARKWPDLQLFTSYNELFTSYNEQRLANWRTLLEKCCQILTVLDLCAKRLFQCASCASSPNCCLRRGDEQLRLGEASGQFCRRCACQRSTAGLLGQNGDQGLGGTGYHRRKTDDRCYGSREALRQLYRYRRYRWKF